MNMRNKCNVKDSVVNFQYAWTVDHFSSQVKSTNYPNSHHSDTNIRARHVQRSNVDESSNVSNGFDSETFIVVLNGIETPWNISIRHLVGQNGEEIPNPVVLCLNMTPCLRQADDVFKNAILKYQFSIFNFHTKKYEPNGIPSTASEIKSRNCNELRTIGFKTITIKKTNISRQGGIKLLCSMNVSVRHSVYALLSSYSKGICESPKSDLVIQSQDGKKFGVHKSILSTKSSVFASILDQPFFELISDPEYNEIDSGDGVDRVRAKQLHSEILEEILHFIYTNSLINASKFAKNLIEVADIYKLPDLKAYCEHHLSMNLSPSNIAEILLIANKHKCNELKNSVLKYCKTYRDYIFKDEDWKVMEKEEPMLYDEVVTSVIGDEYSLCVRHLECLKQRKWDRFELRRPIEAIIKIPFRKGNLFPKNLY